MFAVARLAAERAAWNHRAHGTTASDRRRGGGAGGRAGAEDHARVKRQGRLGAGDAVTAAGHVLAAQHGAAPDGRFRRTQVGVKGLGSIGFPG
jgi:hypothetical protein